MARNCWDSFIGMPLPVLVVCATTHRLLHANVHSESFFDCHQNNLTQMRWGDLVAGVDDEVTLMPGFCPSVTYRSACGELRWADTFVSSLEQQDGSQVFVVTLHDTTHTRTVECSLRETCHMFRVMLDSADVLALILDNSGRIVYANRCLTDLLGMRGRPLSIQLRDFLAKQEDVSPSEEYSCALSTATGDVVSVLWRKVALGDASGNQKAVALLGTHTQ